MWGQSDPALCQSRPQVHELAAHYRIDNLRVTDVKDKSVTLAWRLAKGNYQEGSRPTGYYVRIAGGLWTTTNASEGESSITINASDICKRSDGEVPIPPIPRNTGNCGASQNHCYNGTTSSPGPTLAGTFTIPVSYTHLTLPTKRIV